jgi:PAS domain-containing protein
VEEVADITRVHELTEAAQRRAAELQAVLDNMVDAVFVVDAAGRLTLTNAAATRLFGLPSFAEVKSVPSEFPGLFRMAVMSIPHPQRMGCSNRDPTRLPVFPSWINFPDSTYIITLTAL